MAKPELGTKRVCPSCGTKYYDLNRDPITCPNCGTIFELAARERAAPVKVAAPVAAAAVEEDETDEVIDQDADLVSLEDVEEEDTDAVGDPALDVDADDEAVPDVETLDVEEEIETDEGDTFIEDEEEGGDDVTDLLEVDGEDEEEP